jgi:transcriptional regulator with XRE-family HTH domain
VHGNPELGAMLRQFRVSRRLTRDVVGAQVPCNPSLVSQVETGRRVLTPWLAQRLDDAYGTGAMITGLAGSLAYPDPSGYATLDRCDGLVRLELPHGGGTMIVPRRAVLAALSIGTTASTLPDLRQALAKVPAGEELLTETTQTLSALQIAGRVMAPAQVIDSLIGQVTVLDVVRHRAPAHLRRGYLMLTAQYAETLSWMVQEAGDLHGAGAWVDRTQVWADEARWPAMMALAHVRRSQLASTCAGDGRVAIEHAHHALQVDVPARIRALAAKQIAYGYALLGQSGSCQRALDQVAHLLDDRPAGDEGPEPVVRPLRGSTDPNLMAQFRATCDVYLGGGDRAISKLGSCQDAYGPGSRNHAIAGARLARAYAQAGDPDQACTLALEALNTGQALDSATTRVELRRTLGPLRRWPERQDVAEVRHRITTLGR